MQKLPDSRVGILFAVITLADMDVILAIETSVPEASVALWMDGDIISQQEFASDRNHNSMVFDALEAALSKLNGVKINLVIVGTGPGSYSGTRIGISAGQGIAIAHGCPAVGLGSFAATQIARNSKPAIAVGDARRGVYFSSRIAQNGEAMAVDLHEGGEFVSVIEDLKNETLFTFDPTESLGLSDELAAKIVRTRPEAHYHIDVWQALDAARQEELISTPLSPTYLRAPFTSKAKSGHPLIRR
ncbi:MAG: tRNA (adenosine(37)-N6)-threonylcarbamoyltransferase complex dimerization subunit type 1 TsaB [Akkermansiaceae bacterium]